MREIWEIADEIDKLWTKPYFGAEPYIKAMKWVSRPSDPYGADDGEYLVIYFLANANTWRGADARRIKKELKDIVGIK